MLRAPGARAFRRRGPVSSYARARTGVSFDSAERPSSVHASRVKKGERTREALITAAIELFEREGWAGAGLAELVERSGAPRGSLYFHFPGGKEEIAIAAVAAARAELLAALDDAMAGAPEPLVGARRFLDALADRSERAGFAKGCPITSIAVASSAAPASVRAASAEALEALEARIAHHLRSVAGSAREARRRASWLLSAVEGALARARVAGSRAPLNELRAALPLLVPARL
jgi:TetR/AcrR family transcriptional regulator, lmrAB and yxaGH operons repressor